MPRLNFWQKSRDKSKYQSVTNALDAFTTTESWNEKRSVLELEHALLLTDTAEQILGRRILEIQQSDDPGQQLQVGYLEIHLMLLRDARTMGIYAAWEVFEAARQMAEQDLISSEREDTWS